MTDESRKAFEAQCLRSLIGYTTVTGKFEYTDITTQDQWVIWQRAWQARDAELAAKDARIAELESVVKSYKTGVLGSLSSAALLLERDQLRATLAAIDREVGPEPAWPRLHADESAWNEARHAHIQFFKNRAEHTALKLHEERQRNERLVEALRCICNIPSTNYHACHKNDKWWWKLVGEMVDAANEAIAANAVKEE